MWEGALKSTVWDPCSSPATAGLRTLEKDRVMNSRDGRVDEGQKSEDMTKADG